MCAQFPHPKPLPLPLTSGYLYSISRNPSRPHRPSSLVLVLRLGVELSSVCVPSFLGKFFSLFYEL